MRKLLVAITATATVMVAFPSSGTASPEHPKAREKPRIACKATSCKRRVGHKKTLRRWRHIVAPYRPWLNQLGACEADSSGGYGANTGNGFYGRYQFTLQTWLAAGGHGLPHQSSPLEQDYRAVRWAMIIGWQNRHTSAGWPVCG